MAEDKPETGGGPIKFELVEGATFTLSDGSAVTVRGNELELSDGRTLPMPAAGETITVERTETRPDGSTVRIKHTIRLSETPAAQPAADTNGEEGPEGKDDEQESTAKGKDGEHEAKDDSPSGKPNDKNNADNRGRMLETDIDEIRTLPETPNYQPAKPVIMGLNNSANRSLASMLWGSIPESDDVTTYAPTKELDQTNPQSLLHPQQSIIEADESEEEEHPPEAPEASEDANESFEWDNKEEQPKGAKTKRKEDDNKESPKEESEPVKDVAAAVADAAETAGKVVAFSVDLPPPQRRHEQPSAGRESSPEDTSESSTVPADDMETKEEPHHDKPMLTRQFHVPSSTDLLKDVSDVIIASVGIPTEDEPPPDKQKSPEKSSTEAEKDKTQEPVKEDKQNPNESSDNLSLKLALKNLEEQVTKDIDGSKERKDNTPPNTPAVLEPEPVSVPKVISYYESQITPTKQPWSSQDAPPRVRDDLQPKGPVPEQVIIPAQQQAPPKQEKPASLKKGSPPPGGKPIQEPAAEVIVPKVVNFAVAMQPQKVYLSNQEPEEMENIPIPTPQKQSSPKTKDEQSSPEVKDKETVFILTPQKQSSPKKKDDESTSSPTPEKQSAPKKKDEPVKAVTCKPEVINQAHHMVLVPVRAPPSSEEKLPYQVKPDSKDDKDKTEKEPLTAKTEETQTDPDAPKDQQNEKEKPKPREYDPALFEHEPKKPLVITTETEAAPPYEKSLHDSRTPPMSRKAELATVVTEQPPPFHHDEDREYDPKDPFLPDNPMPGTGKKDDGWIGVCLDLCCCCWAP